MRSNPKYQFISVFLLFHYADQINIREKNNHNRINYNNNKKNLQISKINAVKSVSYYHNNAQGGKQPNS